MKLHFETNPEYQLHAVEAVCDFFSGQETCRAELTVSQHAVGGQANLAFAESDLGSGNPMSKFDDELTQS